MATDAIPGAIFLSVNRPSSASGIIHRVFVSLNFGFHLLEIIESKREGETTMNRTYLLIKGLGYIYTRTESVTTKICGN